VQVIGQNFLAILGIVGGFGLRFKNNVKCEGFSIRQPRMMQPVSHGIRLASTCCV